MRIWPVPRPEAGPSPPRSPTWPSGTSGSSSGWTGWSAARRRGGWRKADVDWINDAGKPLCLALPPRVAARLTVEIAEEVDRRLAALERRADHRNREAGEPLLLTRAHHRKTHLDEIERVLR